MISESECTICDNYKIRKIVSFYETLLKTKLRLIDFFSEVIGDFVGNNVFFWAIGIEKNEELLVYSDEKNEVNLHNLESVKGQEKRLYEIENCFREDGNVSEQRLIYMKHVGGWEEKEDTIRVFYFLAISICDEISDLYFNIAEKVYRDWFSKYLSDFYFLSAESLEFFYEDPKYIKDEWKRKTIVALHDFFLKVFDINLSFITDLSGKLYERNVCNAFLSFCLDSCTDPCEGIIIKETVPIDDKYIGDIRKTVQMVKNEQSLLIHRNVVKRRWEIKGICRRNNLTKRCVMVRILNHMVWEIEISGQIVLCYKCGKYLIENKQIEIEIFEKRFKEVFGVQKVPSNVRDVVDIAMEQEHGTTIIILENSSSEIKRLLDKTIRIEMKNPRWKPSRNEVNSVTSIDGAVLIDDLGNCYAIGVLLDCNVDGQGVAGRGARYNSARKYIITCQNEGINAIAVVVSEDRTIDVFSNQDNF